MLAISVRPTMDVMLEHAFDDVTPIGFRDVMHECAFVVLGPPAGQAEHCPRQAVAIGTFVTKPERGHPLWYRLGVCREHVDQVVEVQWRAVMNNDRR